MRFLLVALSTLAVTAMPVPATATASSCDLVEPVFGLTAAGELVEHDYCVAGPVGEFLAPRVIATFPAGGKPRLFWGGWLEGNASVIYGVTPEGELWWARQGAGLGPLGPRVEIGRQFGDWNRYRQFVSVGRGALFALDHRGHLLRWVHLGWRDGSDTWAGAPQDLGPGCKLGPMVFASIGAPHHYVALQNNPPGYAFCSGVGTSRVVSRLPAEVAALSATMATGPGVTYALTADDRRLARLVLRDGRFTPRWWVTTVAVASYTSVFTGPALVLGSDTPPYKYEWQWPFYDGT